ncbi:MAG TPA: MFS transporter [Stackebrandtia sp.]|jgi:MFS family permease|uniref:MFS transporter n=1 Tax=Stackebrandtia sp. TaxID=2023065 RepID=UPI002D5FA0C4|nr:MFS transporter [Stackebrandtia sp.]HZE37742.1 MFS transporter [Stackebrandtia sp.]
MPAVPERHPRLILGMLSCCGVLVAIMQTIIVPLLPSLPRLTHSGADDVSWTVTITLLTGAVFTPLLGRAGDMYGKRRVLLTALVGMVIGSLMCATSSDLLTLIIGRGLQGAAVAVVPLGISILRDVVPPERVIPSIAIMSATLGVGAAFGIPIATAVIEYTEWHTMFWVSAALGVIVVIAVALIVPESTLRTRGRFDVPGALGLSAFLACLLLVVSKGSSWGWDSPATLWLAAAAVIVGPLWAFYQLRVSAPLVDVAVSIRPAVLFTNLSALLIGFAFYANSLATAQLVQEPASTGYGLGASIFVSGLCLLPGGVAMVILSPVSARLSAARGPRFTLTLATVILAVGYAVRLFTSDSLAGIIVGATVVASGTAVAYSTLPALIMQAVPVTETAAANGLNTLMRTIGQAVCSAIVATVLAHLVAVHAGHSAPTLGAYYLVFVIAGAAALGALVLTLLIPAKRPARVLAGAGAS